MSYNRFGNLIEDYDEPTIFNFKFKGKNLDSMNHKITEFEAKHPNLTLIDFMDTSYDKKVLTGPNLHLDDTMVYREIKYSFKIWGCICYYLPSDELLNWFDCVDQFSQYRKIKYRGGKYEI